MKTSSPTMAATTREFLIGIIDYAGLFPPAKLPLAEAVEQYVKYKNGPESWIVNRFICPAGTLRSLSEFESSFPLCVIGRGGGDNDEWLRNTTDDLALAVDSGQHVDTFEARLPDRAIEDGYLPAMLVDLASAAGDFELFIELPSESDLERGIAALQESGFAKAKLRTGGLTPQTFPDVPAVAGFIYQCARNGVPFKTTAGLHQPLRHYDSEMGVTMHGFVNIFLAAALAAKREITLDLIEDVLSEENGDAFVFNDEVVGWRDHTLSLAEVTEARSLAISFGSCSVEEPLDGLKTAGYIS